MRMDKLTSKFQMALADAQSLAVGRDHQYIEPLHVMTALLDQQGGSVRHLLDKAGTNVNLLRSQLGEELDLIDQSRDELLWVVDFPLFQLDEDTGRWTFVHHPFTSPLPGHEDLIETDPGGALSQHYDLIWNGWELGSGSIRIHREDVQERVFRAMGMTDDEARAKFGYFLDALRMGAPPHGGFALGIERFIALIAGEANIREVVAYPKTAGGSDPLTGAPTPLPQELLAELGIKALEPDSGRKPS